MVEWVIQILLATVFGVAGTMKLVTPKAKLEANAHMGWIAGVPEAQVKLLAVAELLGALGLILPVLTGVAPFLVRVAAACLATLMGGAVATHAMRREPAAVPTALALLAIVIATWR